VKSGCHITTDELLVADSPSSPEFWQLPSDELSSADQLPSSFCTAWRWAASSCSCTAMAHISPAPEGIAAPGRRRAQSAPAPQLISSGLVVRELARGGTARDNLGPPPRPRPAQRYRAPQACGRHAWRSRSPHCRAPERI
jgi:hypothetical protein